MRYNKIIFIFIFISIVGCETDDMGDEKSTCYAFVNGTNKNVQLELFDYNGGRIITELGNYSSSGPGLLVNQCKNNRSVLGPVGVYRFDSIVVKFNNQRKLTYLWRYGENADFIFFGDSYEREGNTLNFSYTFTEEDYNNAVPY